MASLIDSLKLVFSSKDGEMLGWPHPDYEDIDAVRDFEERYREFRKRFAEGVQTAVCVEASPVAYYLHEKYTVPSPTGGRKWTGVNLNTMCPNVKPPFPSLFIEYANTIHDPNNPDSPVRFGALVVEGDFVPEDSVPGVNVNMSVVTVALLRTGVVYGGVSVSRWSLADDGSINPRKCYITHPVRLERMSDDTQARWLQYESDTSIPVYLALSFMHCKNITLRPEAVPSKLQKAYLRRHGIPRTVRKTLQIHPSLEVGVYDRTAKGEGEALTPLHICRGHFKDFRSSGGLFGKYKGLYWWDAHVRGKEENGVVSKEYQINAPKLKKTA